MKSLQLPGLVSFALIAVASADSAPKSQPTQGSPPALDVQAARRALAAPMSVQPRVAPPTPPLGAVPTPGLKPAAGITPPMGNVQPPAKMLPGGAPPQPPQPPQRVTPGGTSFNPNLNGTDRVVKREYTHRGVVLVSYASGRTEELPYLQVPVLFKVNSDLLLDVQSRENVKKLAEAINSIPESDPQFIIEGHAARGPSSYSRGDLSLHRAESILRLLIDAYGVNENKLSVAGLGTTYATHSEGSREDLLQQDRRVIVVRLR